MNLSTITMAKLALSPVLIAQALSVRRKALHLPEPTGVRTGLAPGPGENPTRVLIVGDSSAAGVGTDRQDQALSGQLAQAMSLHGPVHWRLEAKTGATTASTLGHLQRLPSEPYGIALSVLGVNDVTRCAQLGQWRSRQAQIRQILRDRFSVQHIVVAALPPMEHFPLLPNPLRWILARDAHRFNDALIKDIATEPDASFVRVEMPYQPDYSARDGFHPSAQAYALWADHLARHIHARL